MGCVWFLGKRMKSYNGAPIVCRSPCVDHFFFSFLAHHGNSRSTFVNVKRIYEANWGIEIMNEKRFQCKKLTKTEGVLLNNQKAHSVSVTEKNQDPPPQKHIICPSGSFMRFPPKFLSQWRPFPCSSPH